MNAATERSMVAGPAGLIECAVDRPRALPDHATPHASGVALVCHPHPLHGGTMDNKVAQTLARALVQLGYTSVRFNFRGVGQSQGQWDQGQGEVEDALAVLDAHCPPGQPWVAAGFSFGAYVASQTAARRAAHAAAQRVLLVGPAVQSFDVAPLPAGSMVIHGETDDVVPLSAVFDWARPQAQPVTVLPGAGHFFHGQLSVLKQMVLGAWLGMQAPQPGRGPT